MKHSPSSSGDFGLFLSSVGLLDWWNLSDSADWKLNFGSWVLWLPPTDSLFTRRHKELWFFFFFLTHFMACLVAAAQLFADGEFCWDVEFVVGLKVMSELQKPEHAQCRLSALAPGLITSLSVINDNQTLDEMTSSHKKQVDKFSLGNKIQTFSLSWKWSVSSLGGLLFCRGAAAVGRTYFLCWHDEPGNSIITELWII